MKLSNLVALSLVAFLAACGGGTQIGGGPDPDTLTGMMLEPDPSGGDGIDDATGTEIP
jgi:hypothetical protein